MTRLDRLTPDQRAVVTGLRANFCVTSGAGCGKTRVLVERYVQFLEEDLDLPLDRLAAITFTEMAAAQMRDRIRRTCRRRLADADPGAAHVWSSRYWGVDTAPIDTIHGFCASLLRRYPIEAGVDPNFTLLDEAEAALLQQDVVRRAVEALLDAEDPDLLAVLEHVDLLPARGMLAEIVSEKREVLRRVAAPVFARADDDVLARLRKAAVEHTLDLLRRMADSPPFRDTAAALARLAGSPGDARERLRAEALRQVARLRDARTADAALDAAAFLATGINLRGGSARAWPSADDFDAAKHALAALRDAAKDALKHLPAFDESTERAHLALARALFRTAGRVARAYEDAKAAESALDFEDLQIRARDLLRSRPRVLADCRARYRSILVDELQDTNLLQFEIVDLLASADARARKATPFRPGAFFAVGDPKQSIYRFRGAEVEVFRAARDRVGPAGRKGLRESFRLNPGTAALVNRLFAPLMGDLYEDIQGIHDGRNDALGELHVVEKPAAAPPSTEQGVIEEARLLAARIDRLVKTRAVSVWDAQAAQWRPVRFGDVAVLLRRMSNLHLYEEALEHQAVPYYVVAGRGFYKQQEVLDVLHLLRVLDDPADDLHLAGVLRSPFFAASDEALLRLRRLGPSLFDALPRAAEIEHLDPDDLRALERAERLLPPWAAAKDRMGLAALVEHVVFDSGYAASAVGRFGGARAFANLRQMAELARRFEQKGLFSLGDFIDYVTDFMRGEMRAEQAPVQAAGADAVRLMTIHKAKGLEFPVVAIPDLSYAPQNRPPRYAVHPVAGLAVRMRDEEGEARTSCALALARADDAEAERQESYRLLYVALTRAKDYLILTSHSGYNRGYSETWADLLLGLADTSAPLGPILPVAGDHVMRMSISGPQAEPARRGHRRTGPRGIFVGGRVAWDRLRDAADRASPGRAAEALQRVTPLTRPAKAPTRIAATALDTYRRCPALFYWNHVLGLDSPDPADAVTPVNLSPLEYGSLLHRAMELAASPGDPAVRAAADAALREAPLRPGADASALADRVASVVRAFWAADLGRRVAGARRTCRELPVLLALDGTEVAGKMDLLFQRADGEWELVDYKSGRTAPHDATAVADAYRLQLGLYALAAGRWLRRPLVRWSVYFLDSGAAVANDLSPEDLANAEADARKALEGIAAGRFDPYVVSARAHCRFGRLCGSQTVPSQAQVGGVP